MDIFDQIQFPDSIQPIGLAPIGDRIAIVAGSGDPYPDSFTNPRRDQTLHLDYFTHGRLTAQMGCLDICKYTETGVRNQRNVAGMLPFWWPIYRALGVLGFTGWQARLMRQWIPTYEERRYTEQKCLAAIKASKDQGMEISVADIEKKTPFSSILDPDESKRQAWAEEFADQHSWVPVMVKGTETRVRIKNGDDDWKDVYQHNWDATTAYLDEVKPEIPPGTRYSSRVLLRDALSTPTNEMDIRLQGLVVGSFASPDEAIPVLTALANRWEALNTEIKEGDVLQQAKVLRETLQAMVQGRDTAIQADAHRCLTRLNHFLDVREMSEVLRQGSEHQADVAPILQTVAEQASGSVATEASQKTDTSVHQRIREQYGSQRPENETNRLL